MNIATINEILFPLALFFGYFSLACLLLPKQPCLPTGRQQVGNPTAEIKRAFCAEFDPEPQQEAGDTREIPSAASSPSPAEVPLPTTSLALPPAKARKHNHTAPLTNPVLVAPAPASSPELELVPAAALNSIDLDRLPLRQVRKVARALGIRQKVNGKDKPVKFLRAEIKQRLKEQPTAAETIQAALAA